VVRKEGGSGAEKREARVSFDKERLAEQLTSLGLDVLAILPVKKKGGE